MIRCPDCNSEEYTKSEEKIWCSECRKEVNICYCDNCTIKYYSCGHKAPTKRQCSVTRSR